MTISRGLRNQAQANADAAGHEEFAAMLLVALEDPEIAEAIADALRIVQARRVRRNPERRGEVLMSTAGARELKAQRLANRGRTQR